MKYMKIEVETDELGESNLDEIVAELDKRGYRKVGWIGCRNPNLITTNTKGFYTDHAISFWSCFGDLPLTTLAELRSMNIETLKEM